jgi:hypothetical protein
MSEQEIKGALFADQDARRAATVNIVDRLHQGLFYYYTEHEPEIEDEDIKVELGDYMWRVATALMAMCGLRVIGIESSTGRYLATFEPVESVKKFLIEKDFGQEDDYYYEDFLEDTEPNAGLGLHGWRLMDEEEVLGDEEDEITTV